MRNAVNNFQKWLFTILLYSCTFGGLVTDLVEGAKTVLYMAYDATLIFLAIISIGYLKGRLIWVVLFLIACIVVNLSYSGNDFMYSMNGIREILILIAAAVFYFKVFRDDNEDLAQEYIDIFKRFAVIFLIAQLPAAIFQYIQHGPTDWVGGTFGNKGSGTLTMSIICLVFFLSDYVTSNTQRALLYFCLLPLFLNETKVSFIFLPMLIFFIHFKPNIKSIAISIIGAGLFLLLFNSYYANTGGMDVGENSIAGVFSDSFLDTYLMGDIYSSDDVPRFTKIILAWQVCAEETHTLLFGIEYGMFKGGKVVEASQVAQNLQWLMSGTRPYIFFLLLQGGLLLITGIFWLIFHINRYFTENNNKYKTFLLLVFLIILVYNDQLRNQGFVVIYFFCMYYANSNLYNRNILQA